MKRVILVLLFSLAGCSVSSKKPQLPSLEKPSTKTTIQDKTTRWQHHHQQLMSLQNWKAEGRLAASKHSKGNNASFVWEQSGDHYQIKLFGPFGSGAIYISGTPTDITVKEANGKITQAQSPEEALQKLTKWNVPVAGLTYWLRGIPSPHIASATQQIDNEGRLKVLQQNGWKINYQDYTTEQDLILPNKLHLQNNDLLVKVIVKSWKKL